jgi:hypothetical protein
MKVKKYLNWEEVNSVWKETNYLWEDVAILIEIEEVVRRGGGDYAAYVEGNPWAKIRRDLGEEKTKKVIKLYCNYKGIEYDKSIEVNEGKIKVTATEFEKFVKSSIRESISIKVNF